MVYWSPPQTKGSFVKIEFISLHFISNYVQPYPDKQEKEPWDQRIGLNLKGWFHLEIEPKVITGANWLLDSMVPFQVFPLSYEVKYSMSCQ